MLETCRRRILGTLWLVALCEIPTRATQQQKETFSLKPIPISNVVTIRRHFLIYSSRMFKTYKWEAVWKSEKRKYLFRKRCMGVLGGPRGRSGKGRQEAGDSLHLRKNNKLLWLCQVQILEFLFFHVLLSEKDFLFLPFNGSLAAPHCQVQRQARALPSSRPRSPPPASHTMHFTLSHNIAAAHVHSVVFKPHKLLVQSSFCQGTRPLYAKFRTRLIKAIINLVFILLPPASTQDVNKLHSKCNNLSSARLSVSALPAFWKSRQLLIR